jgi:hypothetical protein
MTHLHAKIRQLEVDLTAQGLKVFPSTKVGRRAHHLWLKLRPHFLRGGSAQITPMAVGLTWHRQELARARDVLVEMALIRRRQDGLYVVGRYDPLDELARERFLEVKLAEGVLVAFGSLVPKSKTRKGRRLFGRHSEKKLIA